jgi:hypothetical protein
MREWKAPRHLREQIDWLNAQEEVPDIKRVYVKNYNGNGRAYLTWGSKDFPFFELEINGQKYLFDAQEITAWLRYV